MMGGTAVDAARRTLFLNANVILDPRKKAEPNMNVLVEDGRVRTITREKIDDSGGQVLDLGGKALMPGLIDSHTHITGLSLSPKNRKYPVAEIVAAATDYLSNCLLDGFTTIREAGGADHSIARLLKEKKIVGPRLFYSGKALTQTGGGADFRTPDELTEPTEEIGPFSVMSVIADGVTEVRKAAREELRKGATQVKIFASGGVVFPAEGHVTRYEYSEPELAAIVEEAEARGTYVMAHVYTDEGVQRCLNAGVRSIEHGNSMSAETMMKLRDHGAFWNPTFISLVRRIESAPEEHLSEEIVNNLRRTVARGQEIYARAKDLQVPIGFGTDLWGPEARQSQMHSGNGEHDEMDRRAIACFDQALADVGLADDGALRQVLHDYFAWATTTTMSRYPQSADDVPDGLSIPQWSWDGLQV
jgi:imidazolonepropionase-like amidohydrolase